MSKVNEKLPEASVCPFLNMTLTKGELKVDAFGDAVDAELVRVMSEFGLGSLSGRIVVLLSGLSQLDAPEGMLNLTTRLNQGSSHPADMRVVDPKTCKVDRAQMERVLELLTELSEAGAGVIDLLCFAKAQMEFYKRDWGQKPRPGDGKDPPELFLRLLRRIFAPLNWFFRSKILPLGELSLLLLTVAHRDKFTRTRIIHVNEVRDFVEDGKMPDGWKRDRFSLLSVAGGLFLMLTHQMILGLFHGFAQRFCTRLVVIAHTIFAVVANGINFCLTKPIGLWSCAHVIRRADLATKNTDPSTW